jgi:hypothetical protein
MMDSICKYINILVKQNVYQVVVYWFTMVSLKNNWDENFYSLVLNNENRQSDLLFVREKSHQHIMNNPWFDKQFAREVGRIYGPHSFFLMRKKT